MCYRHYNTSHETIASLITMRIRLQFTQDGSTLLRHVDILQKRHPVFHTCRELAETSARRYSPGWALASLTISLHWCLFPAFAVQPLIPIFLSSSVTSSVHLTLGLPILLLTWQKLLTEMETHNFDTSVHRWTC